MIYQSPIVSLAREEYVEKVVNLCQDFSGLTHHLGISGASSEKVEDDYYQQMNSIEKNTMEIITDITQVQSWFCDFNDLEQGIDACQTYLELLKSGSYFQMKFVNPTLSRVTRMFRILIPNDNNTGSYALNVNKKRIKTTLMCFTGDRFCSVYFDLQFESCADFKTVQVKVEGHKNTSRKITKHVQRPIQLKFSKLISGNAEVKFTRFKIELDKNGATFTDFYNQKVSTQFSLVFVKPKTCQKNTIEYTTDDKFETITQKVVYSVFREPLLDGVFVRGDSFEYKIYKQAFKNSYEIEVSLDKALFGLEKCIDVYLRISNNKVKVTSNKFFSDSNSVMNIDRSSEGSIKERINPVSSFAVMHGTDVSMAVFTDQTRGVFVDNSQIHFGITRILDAEKTGIVSGKFTVLNFDAKTQPEKIGRIFDEIRRNYDVDFSTMILKGVKPSKLDYVASSLAKSEINLPASLKFNAELISGNSLLLRFENHSLTNDVILSPPMVIDLLYPGAKAYEIDFAVVFSLLPEEKKQLKDNYVLKPSDFLSILVIQEK